MRNGWAEEEGVGCSHLKQLFSNPSGELLKRVVAEYEKTGQSMQEKLEALAMRRIYVSDLFTEGLA